MALFTIIPVWSHRTSDSAIRDSIGNTRKTASGNYCKTLSTIQRSDQNYGPFQLLFQSGATRLPLQRVGIPWVIQGKRTPETTVKHLARSNGRIKSYGPFQLLFRSGATRPPIHRVGIPSVLQGNCPPETTVKLSWRPTVGSKVMGLFNCYSGLERQDVLFIE